MKTIKIIGVIFAMIGLPNIMQAQQTVTLSEALRYALEHNATVRKAQLDIEAGRHKVDEVRAQALPQLSGTAGLTINPVIGQQVVDFGGTSQVLKFGKKWNSNAGIQLSQQLFNQQVFTGLQAARSSEEYYSLTSKLTEEQIIELVAGNYYQVLVNRQQLAVIDTNIRNVKVVQKIIANQQENGLAKKIDVDRIRVNLTNLETQREQIVNANTQLENQLKYSMGMDVQEAIILPEAELSDIKQLPVFTEMDINNRLEMKLMDTQLKLLNLQRKAYVSEYYPTLALSGNYTYSSQSDSFDFLTSGASSIGFGSSAIGVTLRVPIFSGFAIRSRVRQADVAIQKAKEDRRDAANGLNLAYENAKIQLNNSLNTIQAQKKNVQLAEEIYKSTQNNYNNELASLTDLLDTESSLTQAQNSYTQALLNYRIAEIQFIKSNGNIRSLIESSSK